MIKPYLTTQRGILFDQDCMKILRSMRSGSVHCVFADPPFNLGKDYKNGFKDRLTDHAYLDWCKEWIRECSRVLKPGGSLFLYALPELAVHFAGFLNESLTFRHWIAICMKGTFPRGRKLYPAHYALLYYTNGMPDVFNRLRIPLPTCRHCGGELKDYGGHRDKLNPEGLNLTDFWDDTSPNRHKKFKVRQGVNELKLIIPERAILISTQPGEIVFDPFGGGGSTYQAAELHDRHWIGCELYDCLHIKRRLAETNAFVIFAKPKFDLREIFSKNENNESALLRRGERQSLPARTGRSLP